MPHHSLCSLQTAATATATAIAKKTTAAAATASATAAAAASDLINECGHLLVPSCQQTVDFNKGQHQATLSVVDSNMAVE
jgi:hypothetical protein